MRSVRAQLKTPAGEEVDVTGNSLAFRMVHTITGTIKVNNAAASATSATEGLVQYDWTSADVDTAGEYWAWFIRTSGAATEHFPAGKLFKIVIHSDTVP